MLRRSIREGGDDDYRLSGRQIARFGQAGFIVPDKLSQSDVALADAAWQCKVPGREDIVRVGCSQEPESSLVGFCGLPPTHLPAASISHPKWHAKLVLTRRRYDCRSQAVRDSGSNVRLISSEDCSEYR